MREDSETVLNRIFNFTNKAEEEARAKWEEADYTPSNSEIKKLASKICKYVQKELKQINADPAIAQECEEITERFMHLDVSTPMEAITGILQINYYLYDEALDVAKWGAWYKPHVAN